MQGFCWAWKKRGHGGALRRVTLLSHEFGLKSPDTEIFLPRDASASHSGPIAQKPAA
jgi:hypothetical protein